MNSTFLRPMLRVETRHGDLRFGSQHVLPDEGFPDWWGAAAYLVSRMSDQLHRVSGVGWRQYEWTVEL